MLKPKSRPITMPDTSQPAVVTPSLASVASTNCVMDLVDSELRRDCAVPSLMTNNMMDAPRPRQSRSVSFNPLSTLCLYEAPEPEDGFNVWYSEEEEEAFKTNARLDASVLQLVQREEPLELEGIFLHPEDLCTVGLEKYLLSPESKLKRLRLKRLVKYSVLMAQARGAPVDGDNRLSKWFVDQAKAIGKLHEKESSL